MLSKGQELRRNVVEFLTTELCSAYRPFALFRFL